MVVWGWGQKWTVTEHGHQGSFWGDKNVLKVGCGDDCTTLHI